MYAIYTFIQDRSQRVVGVKSRARQRAICAWYCYIRLTLDSLISPGRRGTDKYPRRDCYIGAASVKLDESFVNVAVESRYTKQIYMYTYSERCNSKAGRFVYSASTRKCCHLTRD